MDRCQAGHCAQLSVRVLCRNLPLIPAKAFLPNPGRCSERWHSFILGFYFKMGAAQGHFGSNCTLPPGPLDSDAQAALDAALGNPFLLGFSCLVGCPPRMKFPLVVMLVVKGMLVGG